MKELRLEDAPASVAEYVRALKDNTIVFTDRGRPLAALAALKSLDEESMRLGGNKRFLALIRRSRARANREGYFTAAEVRKRFGGRRAAKRVAKG